MRSRKPFKRKIITASDLCAGDRMWLPTWSIWPEWLKHGDAEKRRPVVVLYNQRPHFVVVAALSSLYPVREATTYGLAVVPYGVLRDGEWGAKGPSKRQVKENSSLLREYRCGLHAKTVKRSYSEPVFLGKPVNATYLRGGVVELMANARRDVKGMVVDL